MMAAAATDTRQLLLQVDASISLAQRNLNQLAAQVQRETQQMDQALGRVDAATERMGQAFARQRARGRDAVTSLGQIRSGAQQLSFQIGDVSQQFAMGVRPMTIFAQQSGQVIQAFTMMSGRAGGFLGFLGGPWGAVLTGAAVVVASFAGKLFEQGDAVDELVKKMREKAEQTRNNILADEAWKRTVEGLTEAIRKRREEQEKALQTDIQAEQAALGAARADLRNAEGQRERLARQLERASRELAEMQRRGPGSNVPGRQFSQAEIDAAASRVDDLRRQLADVMAGVRDAEASVRGAEIAISERRVTAQLDAVKAATDRYTEALGRLREERTKGLITQAQFERQLAAETKRRDAAIKDAQEARRGTRETELTSFISPVGGSLTSRFGERRGSRTHAGIDFAVPAGTNVAAAAAGVVITAGTLPGYGNVVIVDHGRGTTTRYAHLSQILVKKGQQVGQGEVIALSGGVPGTPGAGDSRGAHLHYEVRRSGKAVDPRGGRFPTDELAMASKAEDARRRAEEEAAREAERLARNLAAHNRDVAQTNEEIIRNRIAQSESADEIASLELQLLDAQWRRLEQETAEAVRRGDMDKYQREALLNQQRVVFNQRRSAVETKRIADNFEEARRDAEVQRDLIVEEIESRRGLARTANAQRQIELELLDALFAIRQARLEEAQAAAELAGNTREAARIQAQINALPEQRERAEERTRRDTAGPMERWLQTVPQDADEILEAFEEIRVRGLDSLADGIADVATGAKSLGEVFSDVARQIIGDIARMVARMLIMRALMSIFPGLGGSLPGSTGGVITESGAAGGNFIGPRAAGGPVYPGHVYKVGERGEELFAPKMPGVIIPNHALRYGGGTGSLIVHVHAQGAVLTSEVRRWVAEGVVLATETGGRNGLAKVAAKQLRQYP